MTQKILLFLLIGLFGSFFCVKSMEGMHSQALEDSTSFEQNCCDSLHSPSITKLLPNNLTPQIVLAWVPVYLFTGLILLSKTFREKFAESPPLALSLARFSKGVVQRE